MVGQRYGVLKEDQLGNYQTTRGEKPIAWNTKNFSAMEGFLLGQRYGILKEEQRD